VNDADWLMAEPMRVMAAYVVVVVVDQIVHCNAD
jgi:hypothetical protein